MHPLAYARRRIDAEAGNGTDKMSKGFLRPHKPEPDLQMSTLTIAAMG